MGRVSVPQTRREMSSPSRDGGYKMARRSILARDRASERFEGVEEMLYGWGIVVASCLECRAHRRLLHAQAAGFGTYGLCRRHSIHYTHFACTSTDELIAQWKD